MRRLTLALLLLLLAPAIASAQGWSAGTSGSTANAVTAPNRVTANVAVINTVVETTIYTETIAGGTLSTDKTLRLTILGKIDDNLDDTYSTTTLRFKYGGTTVATVVATVSGIASIGLNTAVRLLFELAGDGATNAQYGYAKYEGKVSSGGVISDVTIGGRGTAAVDSTVNQTLVVTAQLNAAVAAQGFTMEYARRESVP